MESIFNLPAHPLFVHFPIVLMPMAATAALVLAVRPKWRRMFGWPLVGAALIVLVATVITVDSGQAFDDVLRGAPTERHESLAKTTRLMVAGFFLGTLLTAGFDQWAKRGSESSNGWVGRTAKSLIGITVGLAVLATVWMVRTGHEGARIVWDGVIPS